MLMSITDTDLYKPTPSTMPIPINPHLPCRSERDGPRQRKERSWSKRTKTEKGLRQRVGRERKRRCKFFFFLGIFGNKRTRLRLKFFFFFFLLINWVLETQFPGGCHVEKMPHQTWLDHENRVFETWFIDQNWVFETQNVSKIYTFETVPINYIVRKIG